MLLKIMKIKWATLIEKLCIINNPQVPKNAE
jgi:hypothetical protein